MLAATAAAVAPARADVQPLTLYEKMGRAPLVVWGEVTDSEHRFAVVKTLEVVKCAIPERPGESFRIAYRLDSFLRLPWQDKIDFTKEGERVLLFLRKFTKEDGEKPEGDLYTLMWGAQGRVTLPPEGEQAWVAAVREFQEIQNLTDLEQQAARLDQAAASRNPIISDGAFEELLRQGLGTVEMVPALIGYFESPREPTRLNAMRLLGQILADARAAKRALPQKAELTDLIRGRAVNDASEAFRVECVKVLTALGGADVRAFLQRLAKEDASQLVRYEAERSLMGWEDGGR